MRICRQVVKLVAPTLLVNLCILTYPWQRSSGVASAFLVPQNSCRIIENRVQGPFRSSRIRQRLSLTSEAAAAISPPSTATELDAKLSGKEAVEQAARRLVPLFAEVDDHTQR